MKKWHWVILAVVVALSLVAQYAGHGHGGWWNRVPAFWGLFGLMSTMVLIGISKALGKGFVQKREDYYDEP